MRNNYPARLARKIKGFILLSTQRLWITFELFNRNGLMNHAAACAYGFLLSAVPALLFISFIIYHIISISHQSLGVLLGRMEPVFGVFQANDIIRNFLKTANSGLAGLISVISIFWTTRLCALSTQRGLQVVFPGARSVIKNNAATLGLGLIAMFIVIVFIFGFSVIVVLIKSAASLSILAFAPILKHSLRIIIMICLAFITLAAYRFFPAKPLSLKKMIPGVLICVVFQMIFTSAFSTLINPDRYNLLYGTLGRLFLFLMNVYFFFVFFFFGAQFIKTLDIFDALFFIRFRQIHSKSDQAGKIMDKIFTAPDGPLKKYARFYKKGETVFLINSDGEEVYYILSGEAGVYLDTEFRDKIATVDEKKFFGEMASITEDVSKRRAASIKAQTDLSVLALPPALFNVILQLDPDTDRRLIKTLSEQLKSINQLLH